MLLAPTSGDVGVQPHGHVARVINRSGGALAIGDLIVTSFAHASVVYPATTTAETRLTPFSSVVKADGSPVTNGYLGAVVDLGSANGANGTEVVVQFGGIVKAKAVATTAISIGSALGVSNTAGQLECDSATGFTSTYPAAVALEAKTIGTTAVINVLLTHDIWFGADV
jgi:hypothetical protein